MMTVVIRQYSIDSNSLLLTLVFIFDFGKIKALNIYFDHGLNLQHFVNIS